MRILHSSDLHGSLTNLLSVDEHFDIWIDTGDLFPNAGKRAQGQIDRKVEKEFQTAWFERKSYKYRIEKWLNGRRAIYIPGEHDYVELKELMRNTKTRIKRASDTFCLGKYRWSGFPHIVKNKGIWNREQLSLKSIVASALKTGPQILITHVPAGGILDDKKGSYSLTDALSKPSCTVRHHFHGHAQKSGGKTQVVNGVRHHNGAGALVFHDL